MGVRTRVLTGSGPLFEGDCEFLTARGADGDLGVLPGHAPLLTWLKPGEVMVRQGDRDHFFFLPGGFLEVLPNRVSVLAERGEGSEQIDLEEASSQVRAAEEVLSRSEPGERESREQELAVARARQEAAERQRRRRE